MCARERECVCEREGVIGRVCVRERKRVEAKEVAHLGRERVRERVSV